MARKYGRGKFSAHPNYIKYMEMIIGHQNYSGMPNARAVDGHINWQVSSGKTTSFYKFYKDRWNWWRDKADLIKAPGSGNSDSRFSLTARLIHPTSMRPCRLCGKELHIGYFYLNKILVSRWNQLTDSKAFYPMQGILEASSTLRKLLGQTAYDQEIEKTFKDKLTHLGVNATAPGIFEKTSHIRSGFLSPGFMSNPPDRLDGFHDYGGCCRKSKDPGRSDMNLKSYIHDRRTFKWWAEGDWLVADTLYNLSSRGTCDLCGKEVSKISPDHIGPLACGFKQIPYFRPTCRSCNSSKNRRLSIRDVASLNEYESLCRESVASWQIRAFWEAIRDKITTDSSSKEASSILRSLQDQYLRVLDILMQNGLHLFLTSILSPHLAHYRVEFVNLDHGKLTYSKFIKHPRSTTGTLSLESRIVRIAFEELREYVEKELKNRKLRKLPTSECDPALQEIISTAKLIKQDAYDLEWSRVLKSKITNEKREAKIRKLIKDRRYLEHQKKYNDLKIRLASYFNTLGQLSAADFLLHHH